MSSIALWSVDGALHGKKSRLSLKSYDVLSRVYDKTFQSRENDLPCVVSSEYLYPVGSGAFLLTVM